jgi:hypothetical protein
VALARIAGETAPLLFTSFGNRYWSTDPTPPMASLTVQIYTYAISPYEDWHRQAWAGAAAWSAWYSPCPFWPAWRLAASNECTACSGHRG